MESVNPKTSFKWNHHLMIEGIPMFGIREKQGHSFFRSGWVMAKKMGIDADQWGSIDRAERRPASLPTLLKAREEYRTKTVVESPRYWIAETVGGICARRCPFCSINVMLRYDKEGKEVKPGMMPWDAWTKFIDECSENPPYGLSAYQLGEPMNYVGHDQDGVKKDIGDIVTSAKRAGFWVVNVSTHADVTNLNRLLECDVDDLIISLDAVTEETYVKNRPATSGRNKGSFDRTVGRVMDFLAEKVKRGKAEPFVVMQIINSNLTKYEVLPFIQQWIQVPGVDSVMVKELDSMRPWIGETMVTNDEDQIKASSAGLMPCQHLWSIGSITCTGVLNACAHDAFTQLTDGSSIYTSTIKEFWNGKFMNELRAEHIKGASRLPCASCRDRDPWLG